jgi:hypothetical protein
MAYHVGISAIGRRTRLRTVLSIAVAIPIITLLFAEARGETLEVAWASCNIAALLKTFPE